MPNYVFNNKLKLVNYIYTKLTNPTHLKIQKTLYLLYAFYGATYGQIRSKNRTTDFENQNYPKELFNANFEAWRYGPVDIDVYQNAKQKNNNVNTNAFKTTLNKSEQQNVKLFCDDIINQTNGIDDFGLVTRTQHDKCWHDVYTNTNKSSKMNNQQIIKEYLKLI